MRLNTRYRHHQRYSLKKGCPPVIYTPTISGTLGDAGFYNYKHKTEPILIQDWTYSFDFEMGSAYNYKHTET